MSDIQVDEASVRIRLMIAESDRFAAEQRKLIAESQTFDRERFLAPWLAAAGAIGGIVAIVTLILRALGIPR